MLTHFQKISLLTFALSVFTTLSAQAQSMQWGTGMAMGMQSCGYQQRAGNGATSESDAVSELLQEQKQLKQTLSDKTKRQKTLEREIEKLHDTISESLNGDIADFAFAHMENGNRCDDYQTTVSIAKPKSNVKVDEEGQDLPPAEGPMSRTEVQNKLPLNGMSVAGLARYCDSTRAGTLRADICSDTRYRASDNKRGDTACKKAVPDYRKKYAESQKIADEIERTKDKLENIKSDIAEARKEAREDRRNGNTEGDVCLECLAKGGGYQSERGQQNQTDWAGVASNVGTGLLAMYMGYQQNKMVAEYNSDLGWPTQSYPTWGYGLPYMAAGLYGAMGGGTGQGSFGCGTSGGMSGGGYGNMSGGAFGYPQGMYGSPMGGGMYSTGSGPWGMSGPNMGMYGGMYGGMMASGGLMTSSYPNYGMMNSGYGMMGSGMMMNSGMMMSGGFGLMNNGMMSSGYGLMNSGYGMMGSGMMGMDSSSMALQSQMYQSYLQQQQQYLQNYQARTQTMTGLQSELSNLLYRIQQVQYGNYYGTGTTSSTSYLNGTTAYTSSPYIPIPASSTTSTYYNSGVIPATTSGSVVIPASSR